jgi:head-tail adaptor
MLTSLPDHFSGTCTIQESTETRAASGQITDSWADLAGHVDIPCAVGQARGGAPAEVRGGMAVVVTTGHVIALAGHYPDITTRMRAVVDETNWNILDIRHDPTAGAYTQLMVEAVSIG